jgi:hypothetical protein
LLLLLLLRTIVQDGLQQIAANPSPSVGRQNGQCHNVQASLSGTGLGFLEARTESADDKLIAIGKLVQGFIVALEYILIKSFVVLYRKRRCIDLSELCAGRTRASSWIPEVPATQRP